MDGPGILLRFALFADLMLLVGIAGHAGRTSPSPRASRPVAALAVLGAMLSVAALLALAGAMAGVGFGAVDRATLMMVLGSTAVGTAWIVRMVALFAVLLFATRPRVALAAGVVALATLAWSGHGAMDVGMRGWVHLVADVAHMVAGALWIGVLAMLCVSLARTPRPDRVVRTHRLLAGFSGVGTALVAVVLASGIVNGWLLVGDWTGLVATPYGGLLSLKLLLFAAMLALAAANRFRLTPALARAGDDPAGAWRALRRSVAAETGCAVAILALVAWLGTLAPPVAGLS